MSREKQFDEQKIIQAALLLFWQRGYEATSVDDLVKHLGVNRSSLYNTFGSKHDIFLLALQNYRLRVVSRLRDLLAQTTSTKEAFRLFCDSIIYTSELQKGWGCLMVNSITELLPGDKSVAEIADAYTNDMLTLIQQQIERDQATGILATEVSSAQLAFYLFNVTQGLRVMAKTGTAIELLVGVRDITLSQVL